MSTITIPYSHSNMQITVPDENIIGVFKPTEVSTSGSAAASEAELVRLALDSPIESEALEDLVVGKKNVVVITSDHTRPVPSKTTLPILLERIRSANPAIDITILVATGNHRATTHQELTDKFGEDIVNNEKIVIHDAFDDNSLVELGILPSGGKCFINKLAVEADLLIAEGFIEPHFFAGFSGGRKSVLPGIAGAETVLVNHCAEFISDPNSRTGNLENNLLHQDMLWAAKKANLAFIMNVILDEDKRIIKAVAGHYEQAHYAGCEFTRSISEIKKCQADIVITSNGGYPLDQNIYQAVKGMTTAEGMCKTGGTIIMIAGCEDGHGGESFFKTMAQAKSPQLVLDDVNKIKRNQTRTDQWQYQILARVLTKHNVILVTDLCEASTIKAMHLGHASTFDQALSQAFSAHGKDARIAVIPDGVSVIVE